MCVYVAGVAYQPTNFSQRKYASLTLSPFVALDDLEHL